MRWSKRLECGNVTAAFRRFQNAKTGWPKTPAAGSKAKANREFETRRMAEEAEPAWQYLPEAELATKPKAGADAGAN